MHFIIEYSRIYLEKIIIFLFTNIMCNQRVGTPTIRHGLVIGYLEEDKLFKDELYRNFEAQDIEIIQSEYKKIT